MYSQLKQIIIKKIKLKIKNKNNTSSNGATSSRLHFDGIVHFKDTFVNYSVICFEMFVQRRKQRVTLFESGLDSSQSTPSRVGLITAEIRNSTSQF